MSSSDCLRPHLPFAGLPLNGSYAPQCMMLTPHSLCHNNSNPFGVTTRVATYSTPSTYTTTSQPMMENGAASFPGSSCEREKRFRDEIFSPPSNVGPHKAHMALPPPSPSTLPPSLMILSPQPPQRKRFKALKRSLSPSFGSAVVGAASKGSAAPPPVTSKNVLTNGYIYEDCFSELVPPFFPHPVHANGCWLDWTDGVSAGSLWEETVWYQHMYDAGHDWW